MIAATYVINLADSTTRWRDMQPLLAAMGAPSPVRFDAVDGAALGAQGVAAMQTAGRLSSDLSAFDAGCLPGEIGCALSHAGVLADIVEKQLPAAMILEDDIELAGSARTWPGRFHDALADLPPTWELWYLYRCFDIEHRVERLSPRTVIPWTPQGGAAYVVTLEGARKLLAALTPVSSAVDRVYQQLVRARTIEAFAASPLLILPGSHPSIINRDNPSKKWVSKGVNRPPEYWPKAYLAHLGEAPPPRNRRRVRAPPAVAAQTPDQQAAGRGPVTTPSSVYFVVWWFDRFGGMERHVTDIAVAMRRRGVRVTVFSETPIPPSNGYLSELRKAGVRVIAPGKLSDLIARLERWPPYRLLAGVDRLPEVGWVGMEDEYLRHQHSSPSTRWLLGAMERHARRSPPDIVHVHGCRLGQHRVLQWAVSRGRPCVYSEHITMADWDGPFDPESPWIVGSTADAVACVSRRSRDSLQDCLPWPRPIHVARHIVRDPRLKDPAAGVPRSAVGKPVAILAVGRLIWYKGFDTLLYAVASLRNEGIELQLKIAGSGEQREDLLDLRARLNLDHAVTFLGQVEQARVSELWKEADIGVVPSLTEGLPLTVVEAMAQATPVVATRVGGIPEVIEHEINGLLVQPGDAGELAAALRRIIQDPALALRLAEGARRAFETGGWSEESVVEQTLSIYDEAARTRSARQGSAEGIDRGWALKQAASAARPLKRVCFFAWNVAGFGDMEYLLAQQVMALALAGVEVLLFVETPVGPFNAYARNMRRAGVKVISPSLPVSLANRAWTTLRGRGSSTPLSRAFARACDSHLPDAIHIHGWRLGCGWSSLAQILSIAEERGVRSIYCEHAVENGDLPPPDEVERAAILSVGGLAGASPLAADYLAQTLGGCLPVAANRHAGRKRPDPPALVLKRRGPFRVFSLLTSAQAAVLAQGARPRAVQVDPAGADAEWVRQIEACDAAILSPQVAGFGRALAEAMSSFKPVVILGDAHMSPIRHRANGLVVASDPAAAILELAKDPVLAHQFALAARRSYELGGLHDLAIVGEAEALYRRPAAEG